MWIVIITSEFDDSLTEESATVYGPFKSKQKAEDFGKPFTLRSLVTILPLSPIPSESGRK
jgi:hypothetical protein